jgi:hypothetical protein
MNYSFVKYFSKATIKASQGLVGDFERKPLVEMVAFQKVEAILMVV